MITRNIDNGFVALVIRSGAHGKSRQNRLAQFAKRTEARVAMNTSARSTNRGRAFVATVVSAAFLWTLVLSVSPQLHARVHSDANKVEHTCAATFASSGNYEHVAHPPLVGASNPVVQFSRTQILNPLWVPSPFLGASIFEHAPPSHS